MTGQIAQPHAALQKGVSLADSPRIWVSSGIRLTPIVLFGQTWLHEVDIAAATGCRDIQTFRAFVRDAHLYQGCETRSYIDNGNGLQLTRLLSIDGATQVALYMASTRSAEYVRMARVLISVLHAISAGAFAGETNEGTA